MGFLVCRFATYIYYSVYNTTIKIVDITHVKNMFRPADREGGGGERSFMQIVLGPSRDLGYKGARLRTVCIVRGDLGLVYYYYRSKHDLE